MKIRTAFAWVTSAFMLAHAVTPASAEQVSEQEAYEIAKDAYVYAYPLMLQYLTFRRMTNFAEPGSFLNGPKNRFMHATELPPEDFKTVVRPNVDTLYSVAWLDLDAEPLVLSVPATDRYFMLPIMSLWTDVFAVPGTRTTGRNTAREFLIVGPRWRGETPGGLEMIRSPTRFAVIGGRTQINGPADAGNVHKIQAGYRLTALSAHGKPDYTPPKGNVDASVDMKTRPPVQVDQMDAATFFGRFAELLKDNPPGPLDYPMIHRLKRVGLEIGDGFDLNAAPASIKRAFERATLDGRAEVALLGRKAAGQDANGWTYTTMAGAYGVNYAYRAAVASFGLGMNLPQDAVYPSLAADADGRPLDGSGRRYVLHFNKNELPPVDAFWSVTAYDPDGYFIPNVLKRQALGDRDALKFNDDGSLDLYIQADSPGREKGMNWLPVARAPFNLMLRLYSPKNAVFDGSWSPPSLRRLD